MSQSVNFTSSWTLAALLVGLVTYHLVRAVMSRRLSSRISSFFHALMSASMAAMALRLGWPVLPQLILFALATHWFVIQAVARAEYLAYSRGDRLKCIYDAGSMAAAGLMILPLGPMAMAHFVLSPGHHDSSPTASEIVMPKGAYAVGTAFFIVTTAVFSLAAIGAALRRRRKRTGRRRPLCSDRIHESAAEAFSAATMAMMLALMT